MKSLLDLSSPARPPLLPVVEQLAAQVSVQNTGAGVTHTVRIESSPGASITTIKEARP